MSLLTTLETYSLIWTTLTSRTTLLAVCPCRCLTFLLVLSVLEVFNLFHDLFQVFFYGRGSRRLHGPDGAPSSVFAIFVEGFIPLYDINCICNVAAMVLHTLDFHIGVQSSIEMFKGKLLLRSLVKIIVGTLGHQPDVITEICCGFSRLPFAHLQLIQPGVLPVLTSETTSELLFYNVSFSFHLPKVLCNISSPPRAGWLPG